MQIGWFRGKKQNKKAKKQRTSPVYLQLQQNCSFLLTKNTNKFQIKRTKLIVTYI